MTTLERKAEIQITFRHKGLSPMAIEKCREAIEQYKIKTAKEMHKLTRRFKRIAERDKENYE